MRVQLKETSLHVINMWTRMPFRYGIATLTALPHLIVRATLDVDGQTVHGLAADGLAPKWFTKDAEQSVEDELAEMMAVVRAACAHGEQIQPMPTLFDWWMQLDVEQRAWGERRGCPALLSQFGATLVERAALDAFCRAQQTTFGQAVRDDALGVALGRVHAPLAESSPADWLPAKPRRRMGVRHTVGLSDPLSERQIAAEDRLYDRLPQSLEACIRDYGLRYFKIKVPADADVAVERLRDVAAVIEAGVQGARFTLDGNEFFREVDGFRSLWERLRGDAVLGPWLDAGLLFVEQPLHRDAALSDEAARALHDWRDRPPIIIDESDAANESLPRALACGYAGTSHKNCKGVFKGVANACLIAQRQRDEPRGQYVLSGEDLANVGPIALLQDLAVAATLGIEHVERNGHHYFAGLSALPDAVQQQVLADHADLYHHHATGDAQFASLTIRQGEIALDSVIDAPFGYRIGIDPTTFESLDEWRFESLGLPPVDPARCYP